MTSFFKKKKKPFGIILNQFWVTVSTFGKGAYAHFKIFRGLLSRKFS